MKGLYVALVVAAVLSVRVAMFRARRRRKAEQAGTTSPPVTVTAPRPSREILERALGVVGLVAGREIRERVRGRIFRVGTVLMLLVVAAAIVIPTLTKSSGSTKQVVGVVGSLSAEAKQVVRSAATSNVDTVRFVTEPSLAAAKTALRSGAVDLVIVDGASLLLSEPASASNSPADSGLVQEVAGYLGVLRTYQAAGLTAAQITQVANAKPLPVTTLQPNVKAGARVTSVIGLVLLFVMLSQYCTWILIGVMQEKASRVVEVLLATVRPIQLLGGKVLGIGMVAMGQAALIVGFALALGSAVGSDLLHGTAPLALVTELGWLVLGYAFYCWVYAAAGSMAERQDQVQTLALPLSVPILIGYIYSITVASSGSTSLFFKVLAYLPPTAPFCMSVLVALRQVHWWEFTASVLISVASTAAMAIVAARIYRRAVLRTGGRVKLRELARFGARA